MARLKTVEISEELRTALAAASFDGFGLASIPTGRDPRRFTDQDEFPQAVVHLARTETQARGIGGSMDALYTLRIFLLFVYEDNDDLNLLKLAHGAELFDWLCTQRAGTHYKLFISSEGGQMPELDYEPAEENVYIAAASNVAVIKLECGIRQTPPFTLQ